MEMFAATSQDADLKNQRLWCCLGKMLGAKGRFILRLHRRLCGETNIKWYSHSTRGSCHRKVGLDGWSMRQISTGSKSIRWISIPPYTSCASCVPVAVVSEVHIIISARWQFIPSSRTLENPLNNLLLKITIEHVPSIGIWFDMVFKVSIPESSCPLKWSSSTTFSSRTSYVKHV